MSVLSQLTILSEANARRICANISLKRQLLTGGYSANGEWTSPEPKPKSGLLTKLFPKPPEERLVLQKPEGISADIGPDWEIVNMAITGASAVEDLPTPTSFLLIGGEPIGLDGGYGPARWFSPALVAEIHEVLKRMSHEQMIYNLRDERIIESEVMSGSDWLALSPTEKTEIVTRHTEALTNAISQAKEANLGFIVEFY